MIALLAIICLIFLTIWLSKGLKKVSLWLLTFSEALSSDISSQNKKVQDNNKVIQQNINAEQKLQNITGETSHAAYKRNVRQEIEELLKEIESPPKS